MRRTLRIGCLAVGLLVVGFFQPWSLMAQAPAPSTGVKFAQINPAEMKEMLTYLASDELEGRRVYTEGYGLAAAYVAEKLRSWGVKPAYADGSYFQSVKNRGYRVTRNSSITVEANGETRTFKHGDHVTFPVNAGGRQTLMFDSIEFAGYGIVALPSAQNPVNYNDFSGRDVKGKLVMWLPGTPTLLTQGQPAGRGRGAGGNRSAYAVQSLGASAVMAFAPAAPARSPGELAAEQALIKAQEALAQANQAVTDAQNQLRGRGAGRGGGQGGRGAAPPAAPPDITTVQRVDAMIPPVIAADEVFYEFVFGADRFREWRGRAEKGEVLAPTSVRAKITVNIDNIYDVISTQLSKNVVGIVEGSDPKLKDTYVMFGSHLDHVGYTTAAPPPGAGRAGGQGAAQAQSASPDLISNGADDDGSGSTALLGIAKAFATGPKPKRSVILVWHTAEESGLLGSRYMADFPVVSLDKVQAQFNLDMIGRNREDDPALGNSVFVIGADRISTDLHNLVVDTNKGLAKPMTLDYEYNDPADPNSFYTRSDHYSYAAKGIPIAFFFTGIHVDYHRVGDHSDKILYPKLTQVAQLVYQAGFNVANSDRTLTRDNRGPRAGRGFAGRIDK